MTPRIAELRDEIIAHPWEAIALAFVAGAYLAFDRTGATRRMLLTTLGSVAVGRIRDAVTGRRAPAARSWTEQAWRAHA